jgi:RNA polymerase primary sigma factor
MSSSQEHLLVLGAFEQYINQLKRIPPLTREEESQLLQRIEHGKVGCSKDCFDGCAHSVQEARDRLVEGYQPLVLSVVRRYVRLGQQTDLLLDLVQEGNLGLLQAIEKYDGKGEKASFRTWAFPWIKGMVSAAFWRQEGVIGLPSRKARAIKRLGLVSDQLLSTLGREPTSEEIAKEIQISIQQVQELLVLQIQQEVASLDVPISDKGTLLKDVIADPMTPDTSEFSQSVEELFRRLGSREQLVMKLRYGMGVDRPRTQREVAASLGIALSMVQALENRARVHLRMAAESYSG